MVNPPSSYHGPASRSSHWHSYDRFPDATDTIVLDMVGARLKRARENWYRDHPLCGRSFGCDYGCPHFSPMPFRGQIFPFCNHPDIRKPEYLP